MRATQAALELSEARMDPDGVINRVVQEQTQIVHQLDYISLDSRNKLIELFQLLKALPECTICHGRGHTEGYCGWNGQLYNTAYNLGPAYRKAQAVYRAHINKEAQKVKDAKTQALKKSVRDYTLDSKAKAVAASLEILQ